MATEKSIGERLWATAIWALVFIFILNFIAMVATVVINSFGTRWFNAWLPAAFTTRWYESAWNEFQLHDVLIVTFEVVGAVVLLSALLGVRRPTHWRGAISRASNSSSYCSCFRYSSRRLLLASRLPPCFTRRTSAAICRA